MLSFSFSESTKLKIQYLDEIVANPTTASKRLLLYYLLISFLLYLFVSLNIFKDLESAFTARRELYDKKDCPEVQGTEVLVYNRGRRQKSCSKKEVFQPHLPVRLPCYDLAPITSFALGRSFRSRTSGTPGFHGLTGGVYKARERIHRAMADARLLANPASRSRVADSDPN